MREDDPGLHQTPVEQPVDHQRRCGPARLQAHLGDLADGLLLAAPPKPHRHRTVVRTVRSEERLEPDNRRVGDDERAHDHGGEQQSGPGAGQSIDEAGPPDPHLAPLAINGPADGWEPRSGEQSWDSRVNLRTEKSSGLSALDA